MSKGKRYEAGSKKLNMKKVFAVIIAFFVVIMFVIGIKTLLSNNVNDTIATISNYYPVYTNGKWGVIDQTGKIIIEPTYEEIITIPNSQKDLFLCVSNVNYETNTYHTTVLNSKNQILWKQYETVEVLENQDSNHNIWYEESVLKVKKDGKYGLINFEGKEILPIEYQDIYALAGVKNSLVLKKEDKIGLSDKEGNIIIPVNYTEIKGIAEDYQKGYIVKDVDQKYGMIDFNKATILETKYEDIKPIVGNNIYIVKENASWKAIHKDGQILIQDAFDDVAQIQENNIIIIKNDKYGIINTEQKEIIKPQYQSLSYLFDDYYIAKNKGKYGIINLNNEIKLPFEYSDIQFWKEAGIIAINKENEIKSEILNTKLEKKLDGIIAEVNSEKGYLRIRVEDQYQYYNLKLESVKSQDVLTQSELFLSKNDGKYGYINRSGDVVVEYQYDDATELNENGYAAVKKDGKWGAIDKTGKKVVENQYELNDYVIIDFIGKWHLGQDTNSYYYTDQ